MHERNKMKYLLKEIYCDFFTFKNGKLPKIAIESEMNFLRLFENKHDNIATTGRIT